jgi:AcrR family transcriptional regulator
VSSEPGLRERKKQQTRQLIADTAWQLFAERGFDAVPVTEIARLADVSEATVYNYFPTKEDLVYGRMEAFEDDLLSAVREREPGESIPAAFGRYILDTLEGRGMLASNEKEVGDRLAAFTRVITQSPALVAREQQIFARYTQSLAALIAEDAGAAADDVTPWVVANALMGVHRGLLDHVRRRVLAGARNPRLGREVRAHGLQALELLDKGFAGYGAKKRERKRT